MESFEIKFTSAKFNYLNGKFVIKGHFIFNKDEEQRILILIKEYMNNPEIETNFHFKVHYLDGNIAGIQISEIYQYLKPLNNLKIYWEFDIGDQGGREIGEILKKDLKIPLILNESDFNE